MNDLNDLLQRHINKNAGNLTVQADQDYITARMCYHSGLIDNYLWNAQQCIEKYLKSIALFQRINVKKIGHDLPRLYKKVNHTLQIGQPSIDIFPSPKDEEGNVLFPKADGDYNKVNRNSCFTFEGFLEKLTYLGLNRYFSYSYETFAMDVKYLDAAVWIIRRYCLPLDSYRPTIKEHIDSGGQNNLIKQYLERVMEQEVHPQKTSLLENNFYYPALVEHNDNYQGYIISREHPLDRMYEDACSDNLKAQDLFIEASIFLLDHLKFDGETEKRAKERRDEIQNIQNTQLRRKCGMNPR